LRFEVMFAKKEISLDAKRGGGTRLVAGGLGNGSKLRFPSSM